MKREHTYRVRRTAGFTLVELIVVLVMVSVIAGFAVPTFLGFVDDNKAKQCEINRKKVVSYLEDMLVTNPNATLEDVLNTYRKEDGDQDIDKDFTRCPVTGKGYTCVENTVVCEAHGGTTAVKRSDKSVTAKLDNALKEEKQTEAEGGIPEPEGGGNNTLEPNKPDQTESPEPKLEVEISPNPLTLKVNESWTMSVSIIKQENCPNLQYQWTVPENRIINGSSNGSSISLTGKQAGSGTVTCTVTAVDTDGKKILETSASANVTVEELQKIALEVSPTSKSIKEGETATLTASVTPANVECDYTWSSDHPEIATVTNENKNTATVTGVTASGDAVTITCTATPKSGQLGISTEAQTATATIKVESEHVENDEIYVSEIVIDGGNMDEVWYHNLSTDIENLGITLPAGGTWILPENVKIIPSEGNLIQSIAIRNPKYNLDETNGNVYSLEYQTEDKTYVIPIRIEHPADYFGIESENMAISLNVGEEKEISAFYNPVYTTDKLTCSSQNEDIVSCMSGQRVIEWENIRHKIKIKGVSLGSTTVTVQIHRDTREDCIKTWQINVVPPEVKDIRIEQKNVLMEQKLATITVFPEESGDVVIYPVPAGASLENFQITVSSPDASKLSVKDNTSLIAYQTDGISLSVTAQIPNSGPYFSKSATLKVQPNPNKLTGILAEPSSVTIQQGEQIRIAKYNDANAQNADILIKPIPNTAGLVDFTYKCYYLLNQSGEVFTASEGNAGSTSITIRNDTLNIETNVNVQVTPKSVYIGGNELDVTSWNKFRDYLMQTKNGIDVTSLIKSSILSTENQELYILKEAANLAEISGFANMSFADFINGYRNMFAKIDKYNLINWPVQENQFLESGRVLMKDGAVYVYVGENRQFDVNWTSESDLLNNGFVKVSK